jgi:hypothetical protein
MRDLWWKNWLWNRFLSNFFSFPMSISFHRGSTHSHVIWGTNNRLVDDRSSETVSTNLHEQHEQILLYKSASDLISQLSIYFCACCTRTNNNHWNWLVFYWNMSQNFCVELILTATANGYPKCNYSVMNTRSSISIHTHTHRHTHTYIYIYIIYTCIFSMSVCANTTWRKKRILCEHNIHGKKITCSHQDLNLQTWLSQH